MQRKDHTEVAAEVEVVDLEEEDTEDEDTEVVVGEIGEVVTDTKKEMKGKKAIPLKMPLRKKMKKIMKVPRKDPAEDTEEEVATEDIVAEVIEEVEIFILTEVDANREHTARKLPNRIPFDASL